MAGDLGGADAVVAQDPGLAFEIWFTLERTGGAPEDVDWSPEELSCSAIRRGCSPASRTACCASAPTP